MGSCLWDFFREKTPQSPGFGNWDSKTIPSQSQFCSIRFNGPNLSLLIIRAVFVKIKNSVTFPPVVFFTFFYYTDNGSLLTILAFLLLIFKEKTFSSCLFAIAALFFRQTSLIWIFFTTCISILYQNSRLGETIRTVDKELLTIGLNPFVRYNWDQVPFSRLLFLT